MIPACKSQPCDSAHIHRFYICLLFDCSRSGQGKQSERLYSSFWIKLVATVSDATISTTWIVHLSQNDI